MPLKFGPFELDPSQRRLTRDGVAVELSSRYFDALLMLVRQPGELISRDAFFDQAWRGIPVTDEALSQCITQLRRALGDSSADPKFIATVPKHGYRFIAAVEPKARAEGLRSVERGWELALAVAVPAAVGGALAGMFGGLIYGFALASAPRAAEAGAGSTILVMLAVGGLLGVLGGFGVGLGVGAARHRWGPSRIATAAGGGLGGGIIGGVVELVGADAFVILLGRGPGAVGGFFEGLLLGASFGLGSCGLARKRWPSLVGAAAMGAAAGLLIALLGGRLLAGSLAEVAAAFPGSRLAMDSFGRLFGEPSAGPVTLASLTALEGLLFALGVAVAIRASERPLR